MKTVEIPDQVFALAEAKARAEGLSVEALIAKAVENAATSGSVTTSTDTLPLIRSATPGTIKLSNEDIARAQEAEDLDRYGRFIAGH